MDNLGINVILDAQNLQRLLWGLGVTIKVSLISVSISIFAGILMGILMNFKNKLVRFSMKFYLETVRIIPILVWLIIFNFWVARLIEINNFVASILVFTLWGTAEMGDLVRGAIISLPKQQIESAKALGLNSMQIYFYVVIPLIVRRIVPSAINLSTRMIKTTSLIFIIGIVEVIKVGQQIIEASIFDNPKASFWIYGLIFFLYFLICYPISLLSQRLENRWQN